MVPAFDPVAAFTSALDVGLASHANGAQLAARQRQRLAALLTHAGRHSPLYREVLGNADPHHIALEDLPVQHKRTLMHRFDDWVTDSKLKFADLQRFTADPATIGTSFAGRYTVWESSGSSGEPGLFVQDAGAMAVYDALEGVRRLQLRPLAGLLEPWSTAPIAFVGAVDGHFASIVSVQRLRRLNPWLGSRLHTLSFLQPLASLVAQLQELAPAVISTYPSMAFVLAQERLAGRLSHAPREIWTGGETLSAAVRREITQAFGCAVVNSYGASEFLSLAHECSAGRLHLNCDWAILESLDENGHPVPDGEAGTTTLLTNLANHVQPLIRYELGDSVTVSTRECDCGSHLPVIDVRGRDDDVLMLTSADGRTAAQSPLALTTLLEDEVGLFDFQLVQQGPVELRLSTGLQGETALGLLRRARQVLGDYLASQGTKGIRISCMAATLAPRGRSGKAKRVVAQPRSAIAASSEHPHNVGYSPLG